jgi:hypothetical protein
MRSRAYVPFMEQHRLCIKLGHHGNNITQQRLDGGWTNQKNENDQKCFLTVFVEFLVRRVTAQNWLQQLLIS